MEARCACVHRSRNDSQCSRARCTKRTFADGERQSLAVTNYPHCMAQHHWCDTPDKWVRYVFGIARTTRTHNTIRQHNKNGDQRMANKFRLDPLHSGGRRARVRARCRGFSALISFSIHIPYRPFTQKAGCSRLLARVCTLDEPVCVCVRRYRYKLIALHCYNPITGGARWSKHAPFTHKHTGDITEFPL